MRRLARRLFMLSSAASLVLFLAASAAWSVSLFRTDTVGWVGWDDRAAQTWQGRGVTSYGGWLVAYHFTSGAIRLDESPHNLNGVNVPGMRPHVFHHRDPFGTRPTWPAFTLRRASVSPAFHIVFVAVPHLAVAIPLALAGGPAGVRWLTLALRRRRPDPGCCTTCGYDLRASPERCPECGASRAADPDVPEILNQSTHG